MTVKAIATLPAHGYQFICIDDDSGETDIDKRLSEPEIVLGFVVTQNEWSNHPTTLSVHPVTAHGVHLDHVAGSIALLRPDGKVDVVNGPYTRSAPFDSLHDLKQHIRYQEAECYQETAIDMTKDGDRKGAASMRRVARELRNAIDEND